MIGFLRGKVLEAHDNLLILLVNESIGYEVFYGRPSQKNSIKSLYLSHIVRENSQDLYGFDTFREKVVFEMLLDVSGVGPKSAYSLVASLGAHRVTQAILLDDKKLLKSAPGIGPKAAAQIILDLRSKVEKLLLEGPAHTETATKKSTSPKQKVLIETVEEESETISTAVMQEALQACYELGFSSDRVMPLISEITAKESIASSEQLVRKLLKQLG